MFRLLSHIKHSKYLVKPGASFVQSMKTESTIIPRKKIYGCFGLISPFTLLNQSNSGSEKRRSTPITQKSITFRNALNSTSASLYETIRVIFRALRLALTFVPLIILYPMVYTGTSGELAWYKLLLFATEMSGPIFIKFGQWISTRQDLFPESCCRQFSRLQRRANTHSWEHTKYEMRKAFGKNWRKIFVKFDNNRQPVGSGCVAQVYKAWMVADKVEDESVLEEMLDYMKQENPFTFSDGLEVLGFKNVFSTNDKEDAQALDYWKQKNKEKWERTRSILHENIAEDMYEKSLPAELDEPNDLEGLVPVAIKVLHPGVRRHFERDLKIFQRAAWFLSTLIPSLKYLSLNQCVTEFGKVMSAQIDLEIEASNLERFTENFSNVPTVRFPSPVRPFVTSKVLVETFEEGQSLSSFMKSTQPVEVNQTIGKIGIDALLRMIFNNNFVHGDLHPGNIIIQNEESTSSGDTSGQTKLMMVDVGSDLFVLDVVPDPNPLRICILDCGVVSSLELEDLRNFKALFKEVVLGNGNAVGDLFLENSSHQCSSPDDFRREMSNLVMKARDSVMSLSSVNVGCLLQDVMATLMKHKVRVDASFSSVVLAVFVLEGIGRTLDGNLNILESARPFLLSQ